MSVGDPFNFEAIKTSNPVTHDWSISSAQSMPRVDPELSAIRDINEIIVKFINEVKNEFVAGEFSFSRVQRILDYFSGRYGASREE